jgi:hypothetical protein
MSIELARKALAADAGRIPSSSIPHASEMRSRRWDGVNVGKEIRGQGDGARASARKLEE